MKKFGLFISIALLTAFVGCDSDDVEDPVVPAVSKPVVAVSENTPTSFGVEWDAVDEAAGYQYVVTESDAAGNTSEFCPETQTDKTSLRFDDAAAGAKYTVKVKALAAADSQLADSEYAEIFVETPAEGLSSQTFAFTVDPVGYDSATVKVEPSIADETYFFAVVKSSLLLDKNSNAIIEMLKKDIEPESLVKGEPDDRGEMARSRNRLCGRSVRLRCGQGRFDVGAEPFGEVLDRRRSPHVDRCFGHECGR